MMSEKSKSLLSLALSVFAALLAIGAIAVNAGIYQERIDQNRQKIESVEESLGNRVNRIDRRVGDLYKHFLGDDGG